MEFNFGVFDRDGFGSLGTLVNVGLALGPGDFELEHRQLGPNAQSVAGVRRVLLSRLVGHVNLHHYGGDRRRGAQEFNVAQQYSKLRQHGGLGKKQFHPGLPGNDSGLTGNSLPLNGNPLNQLDYLQFVKV